MPDPPQRSRARKAQDWFNGLSEAGKIGLIGAVVTTVGGGLFGVIIALIPVLADGADGADGEDGKAQAKPSALASETPEASGEAPASASPSKSAPTESAPTEPVSYEVVYQNQRMSLGLSYKQRATLDFDAPSARRYGYDEWDALKGSAQDAGVPIVPDLSYHDAYYGYLMLSDGRSAAQSSAEEAPDTDAECAADAKVGGFSETNMTEWKLPAKTVFCVLTDKGNVVRAQIEGFDGQKDDPDKDVNDAPEQIEFNVTMWRPAA